MDVEPVGAAVVTDEYGRNFARNLIGLAHHAIRQQEFGRAHELLDDLLYTFVGRKPDSAKGCP